MDVTYTPADAFPVGTHIADELEARRWSVAKFAKRSRLPLETVTQIIDEGQAITPEIAEAIVRAFRGTSAQTWLNLQKLYDDVLERSAAKPTALTA